MRIWERVIGTFRRKNGKSSMRSARLPVEYPQDFQAFTETLIHSDLGKR